MPGPTPWSQQAFAYGAANQTITTTTELAIVTLGGLSSRSVGAPINLTGWAVITGGASTTAVVLRIRQDSLTGAVVQAASTDSAVPATIATAAYDVSVVDQPAGEYNNKSYVFTVQQTGATGNGTVVACSLMALY